jgi:hypothetical protein
MSAIILAHISPIEIVSHPRINTLVNCFSAFAAKEFNLDKYVMFKLIFTERDYTNYTTTKIGIVRALLPITPPQLKHNQTIRNPKTIRPLSPYYLCYAVQTRL